MQNIGHIPVLENGELIGIVTREDIMKVIELKEM
ncbi:MAG: CBS domain-containing protein [Methanoregulaceae archaeon]|nr:CBS domain-containing protein [Methanoregulaceae archaeon]